jgi:hypothetical protein
MMIPIKIQCGCGQRYAFDVEPVNGRMTSSVACPVCGADGTFTANAIIAQSAQPQPPVAPEPAVRLHVVTPASPVKLAASAPNSPSAAPHRSALLPGQLEPAKAEAEAKSKIFWGEPPEDVVKFLMMHSFSHQDASVLVRAMFQERATTLQGIGIRKIVTGIALMAVPVVTFIIFAFIHLMLIKLLALAVMVGLCGAWMFLKGLIMVLAPKFETGDVADL